MGLSEKLKKKRQEENPFVEEEVEEPKLSHQRFSLEKTLASLPQKLVNLFWSIPLPHLPQTTIHIRGLRTLKRIVATGLFFMYGLATLAMWKDPLFILTGTTCLLLLDYLHKTRRSEEVFPKTK